MKNIKKIFIFLSFVFVFCLTGCSNSTPGDINELYTLFENSEFNNVTISVTNYVGGTAIEGSVTKVDGKKYHIIESRDEEYYLEYGNTKVSKYYKELGEWNVIKYDIDFIDMSMKTLFSIFIEDIELDDFVLNDDIYTYEDVLENVFNTQTTTYTLVFSKDSVELKVSESVTTNTSNPTTTTTNIKDTKLTNFNKTKVELPTF